MERREQREGDPAEAADHADTTGLQSRSGCWDRDNKTSAATESKSPLACFPRASAAQFLSDRPSESHSAELCGPRRGAGSRVGTGDHCKPRSLPRPGSTAPRSPVTLPSQAVRASAPQAHYREPRAPAPRRLGAASSDPRALAPTHFRVRPPTSSTSAALLPLAESRRRRLPGTSAARSRLAAARGRRARASARAHARASSSCACSVSSLCCLRCPIKVLSPLYPVLVVTSGSLLIEPKKMSCRKGSEDCL